MIKDELINKILNAPNTEEEMEEHLKSKEIDFFDFFTEEEIDNLIDLFDSKIYEDDAFFSLPVFYKINQYLKQNNINLNNSDLYNLDTRIEILEILFKIIKESQDYSVYTERALFEIILSIGEIEPSFGQSKRLENLNKDLIDYSYFLYDKTRELICIENILNSLLNLSRIYVNPNEIKKLLSYYNKYNSVLQPEALSNRNIAFYYFSSLITLISRLIHTNHLKEAEKYLDTFLNYSKQYFKENKLPRMGLSLNLTLLAPVFKGLDLTKQVKLMINKLIEMIESFLKDTEINTVDRETFLVDLSILYLIINDIDNSISYLDEAAKLVKENVLNENPVIASELISHLFSLENLLSEEKYSQFLFTFFQAHNNKELYYFLKENSDNEEYESYLKETNKKTENLEAEYEIITEETPSIENFIELSDLKLSVAYDSVYYDDFKKAQNKIKELEKILGKFSEYQALADYKRIQFEIHLFEEFITYLNDESININDFINISSKLINSYLFDYKNNYFKTSPISGFLKAVGKLILLEDNSAALIVFKRIQELFKEFSSSQKDLETLQSYFILLNSLSNLINDQESLDWIDKARKEITYYIEKLNIPESDYISNNPYLEEASKLEELNNYTKALFTYERAVDYLLLYPNAEKNHLISDEIGETYLDIGRIQRELGATINAINSYKKGLDYLIRYGLNKKDYKHITDILVANSAIGGMYLENEEFKKSFKFFERQDGIIKNTLSDIHDSFFLNFYLEELNNRFFLLHALKKYSEQEDLFEEMLSLFDNNFIRNEFFEDLILFINSFINWNKDASQTPGIWSWKKYIQEIFNKLRKYKISSKLQNFDINHKNAFLNLSLNYIEYCLELSKPIPNDFLTQTIKLAREISKNGQNETQNILETVKELEWIQDQQRSMITRSFTKKKKMFKKRGKKISGQNKKRKKKKK